MAVKNIFETMSSDKLDLYTEILASSRKINPQKSIEASHLNIETKCHTLSAKIKVIGVGGGGGNMINHMINVGVNYIDLIVANTDSRALDSSSAPYKLQLGMNATRGLGAGMIPEKGREAALESFDDIKEMLEGSDIVFISAGLGGGTGTGASPIIAQAAKEVDALTVSIVTSPFNFEGRKRTNLAKEALIKLKIESDVVIVVSNQKLLSMIQDKSNIQESFKMVDDILTQTVTAISKILLSDGENDINIDFSDVQTVMSYKGLAHMGIGYSCGDSAAYDAAKMAIESPLLDHIPIDGAMGVLVQFDIHPKYPLSGISEALDIIDECLCEDADLIFGTTTDESMKLDEVRITIVATGFEIEDKERSIMKNEVNFLPVYENTNNVAIPLMGEKVVGGYDNEDILDVPLFLRKKMD